MKLRPFELALVVIFGGLALGALIMLKVYDPPPSEGNLELALIGQVDIWGTLPSDGINSLLKELGEENEAYANVTYRYYSPDRFDDTLVTALADGVGPDLILVSQEKLVEMRKRIYPFSPEQFPLPDFKNAYVDGAEIFYLSDGLYGYPMAVDPLMLYWNRDILSTEGYLAAPKTWENLVNVMFPKLISRDFDRNIDRSVVAMGEYKNVRNAFGIISALLIQQGTKGVIENQEGKYLVQLSTSIGGGDPLVATADFYTRFSRPSNALYSWNRSLPNDRLQFVGEDLAFYFGYGSEGPQIERLNPNLNFGIAEIPQGEAATVRRTYGRFYALSMLKSTNNPVGAGAVMFNLGGAGIAGQIAVRSGLVPVHRSLLEQGSNDIFGRVTYQSAPVARGWLNPSLSATEPYFETMLQDINENRQALGGATSDLVGRLSSEY